MTIASTAFQNNQNIPSKYTCDGQNINPPLTFSNVPANTQSLVLIVEDLFEPEPQSRKPDAPSRTFIHWLIYNIPPATLQILENEVPPGSVLGITDFGEEKYGGPCPPSGVHRYFFKLFALDATLNLSKGASKENIEKAMERHILDQAELIGLYARGS